MIDGKEEGIYWYQEGMDEQANGQTESIKVRKRSKN